MRKSRIVSVVLVTICALAAVVPACVTSESTVSSASEVAYDFGSGDTCTPPEYAGTAGGGSGSGSSEPPVVAEPDPGPGSGGGDDPGGGYGGDTYGGDTYGGYARLRQDGFPVRDYKMLADGTVVFAGGPAPNEATCAGACFARGCGAYTWNGNITTGCKCFLNTGWKWCLSASCNPAALAAGGAMCTAATCP